MVNCEWKSRGLFTRYCADKQLQSNQWLLNRDENILPLLKLVQYVHLLPFICLFPAVKCGHPAVPLNTRVSLTNPDLAPGTAATYTCDEGYELFG
jgi:hypothetical protein